MAQMLNVSRLLVMIEKAIGDIMKKDATVVIVLDYNIKKAQDRIAKNIIKKALKKSKGNLTKCAKLTKMNRVSLMRKMKALKIRR